MIGAILLIVVVVAAMSILMVAVISQPQPQKVPALDAEVTATSTALVIMHDGGDSLRTGDFAILVDGVNMTSSFTKSGADPAIWNIGESLTFSAYNPLHPPKTIQIVYTEGGSGSTITQLWVPTPTPTG